MTTNKGSNPDSKSEDETTHPLYSVVRHKGERLDRWLDSRSDRDQLIYWLEAAGYKAIPREGDGENEMVVGTRTRDTLWEFANNLRNAPGTHEEEARFLHLMERIGEPQTHWKGTYRGPNDNHVRWYVWDSVTWYKWEKEKYAAEKDSAA